MRINSVRFAALAATVSLGILAGGVSGALLLQIAIAGPAMAADPTAGSALGSGGTGLGTGGTEQGGGSGSDQSRPAEGTDDRAVDRTIGLGQSSDEDQSEPAGGAGEGQALGKASESAADEGETTQPAARASSLALPGTDEPEAAPDVNAPDKPSLPEISGNGFFSQQIGIDVPAFHGLEPKITLNYNSGRKTRLGGLYQGWLGYAWALMVSM